MAPRAPGRACTDRKHVRLPRTCAGQQAFPGHCSWWPVTISSPQSSRAELVSSLSWPACVHCSPGATASLCAHGSDRDLAPTLAGSSGRPGLLCCYVDFCQFSFSSLGALDFRKVTLARAAFGGGAEMAFGCGRFHRRSKKLVPKSSGKNLFLKSFMWSWPCWHTPVIPVHREAEARRS